MAEPNTPSKEGALSPVEWGPGARHGHGTSAKTRSGPLSARLVFDQAPSFRFVAHDIGILVRDAGVD